MALIIEGKMPTKCCLGGCPIHESCNKYDSLADTRPSDCPILGELPDKHGRLIDVDELGYYTITDYNLEGHNVVDLEDIENAPTVLEASK